MCAKILYTDLFEYANDAAAQAAWVTDAAGLEIDYMEYATDGAAQAAYVSSDTDVGYGLNVLTGGTASAESSHASFPPANAFDENTATDWVTADSVLTSWLKYDLGVGQSHTLAKYVITFRNHPDTSQSPRDWTFQGSNNDSDWDTLDTQVDQTFTQAEEKSYTFANSTAYRYYRLDITENNGSVSYLGLAELEGMEIGTVQNLQCYSEDTIKEQGDYSLKAIAVQTDSLNDTLTKSGLSIDLTDIDELKLDVYASRTGTNLQLQIHDSGGTTSTKDIVISQVDTWTEITWDISGIANADKDNIDQIIIKIINADSANTFYVDNFRVEVDLQCYSEDTIKQQGSYSLKAVAAQTGSLNKTLTKTLTDYLDYSIMDVIKLEIRASRTGSNIKLKIHDTGGTTSEHTINIASADTWQTEIWDISGISAANRDTIDKIIIEIINADAANTLYFDNMYSKAIVETSHVFLGG